MIVKVLSFVGLFGGAGMLAANVMPMLEEGSKMHSWPATAIMGFITLCSLAITYSIVLRLFKAIEMLERVVERDQELCARLNVRPCLKKREDEV